MACFRFGGRVVADRLEMASVVEPVDPFESRELDGLEVAPRPLRRMTSVLKSSITLSARALS